MKFDYLPEKAEELYAPVNDNCICRHDHIVDDSDYEDAIYFHRMQRLKFALVELNPNCRYGDHAERFKLTVKRSEPNIIT